VTHTPLGIDFALAYASKLTVGIKVFSDHQVSLGLSVADRLVKESVQFFPR